MSLQLIRFDDVPTLTLAMGGDSRPHEQLGIDIFCPVREDYRERWEGSSAAAG